MYTTGKAAARTGLAIPTIRARERRCVNREDALAVEEVVARDQER